jgi:hypothetical protein
VIIIYSPQLATESLRGVARDLVPHAVFADQLQAELGHAAPILRGLVDAFVPFLPMGPAQVRLAAVRHLQAYACRGARDGQFADLGWSEDVLDHVVALVMAGSPQYAPVRPRAEARSAM